MKYLSILALMGSTALASAAHAQNNQPTEATAQDCDALMVFIDENDVNAADLTRQEAQRIAEGEDFTACRSTLSGLQDRDGAAQQDGPQQASLATGEADVSGGRIMVLQPKPRVSVEQPAPKVTVNPRQPKVTVDQPQPQVIVRQQRPTVTLNMPQPTITIDQPQPEIIVRMPQPDVAVQTRQPQVQVSQAQPRVTVQQPKPQVRVNVPQPDVNVEGEERKAQIQVQRSQPVVQMQRNQQQAEVDIERAQPEVRYEAADQGPQVKVQGNQQPKVNYRQTGEPQVRFERLQTAQGEGSQTQGNRQQAMADQQSCEALMVFINDNGVPEATEVPEQQALRIAGGEDEQACGETLSEFETQFGEQQATAGSDGVRSGARQQTTPHENIVSSANRQVGGDNADSTLNGQARNGQAMNGRNLPAASQARGNLVAVTDLENYSVVNGTGEVLGDVERVVRQGGETYVIIGHGGFLGLAEDQVALPLSRMTLSANDTLVLPNVSEEEIEAMHEVQPDTMQGVANGESVRVRETF